MTARRLIDLLIAWQQIKPETRHIVDDLGDTLGIVHRELGLSSREAIEVHDLFVVCNNFTREMPDD